MIRTLLVVLVIFAAGEAVAHADRMTGRATTSKAHLPNTGAALPRVANSTRVSRAVSIASSAWGVTARVEWTNFRTDPRTRGYGQGRAYGAADPNTGVVMLNVRRAPFAWCRLVTVLLHEFGHIAGWTDPVTGDVHSSDPFSLMYPEQFPDLRDDGLQEHLRVDGRWVVRPAYDSRCNS
jgi:hypothetical protein